MSDAIEAACREFLLHEDTIPWRIGRRSVELWGDYAPAIRAAITAYEAAKGGGVGVKPLEWKHLPALDVWSAASGTYWAWERNGIGYWRRWWPNDADRTNAIDGGQECAEAACQVDYETRIRSALTSPASGERDAVIEECAAVVRRMASSANMLWNDNVEPEKYVVIRDALFDAATAICALRMEGK